MWHVAAWGKRRTSTTVPACARAVNQGAFAWAFPLILRRDPATVLPPPPPLPRAESFTPDLSTLEVSCEDCLSRRSVCLHRCFFSHQAQLASCLTLGLTLLCIEMLVCVRVSPPPPPTHHHYTALADVW
jgi:hypothetical protein